MKKAPRTLAVILHYGSEIDTRHCLNSLTNIVDLDLLIVDNDPSQSLVIWDDFFSTVRLIRTGGNCGFAEANNIGVKYGRREHHDSVFILNNDTLVLDNALEELLKVLNQPNVAAVGPCMKFLGQPTIIWACGGFINKYRITIGGITNINENKPYDVDYLPGAAILCKLEFWDLVQGLPEKYFLCFEEAEFALRLKHFNLRIVAVPTACVLHGLGMSSDRQPM